MTINDVMADRLRHQRREGAFAYSPISVITRGVKPWLWEMPSQFADNVLSWQKS